MNRNYKNSNNKSNNSIYRIVFRKALLLGFMASMCAFANKHETNQSKKSSLTKAEIIEAAPNHDWRSLDLENTLYIKLNTGMVVVELAPQFAPEHVKNTKQLVRKGLFNNTQFYRVIDGFVAQGGLYLHKNPEIKEKKWNVIDEYSVITKTAMPFAKLNISDGYADEVGVINGFAAARTKDKKEHWLAHCYGAFAMARSAEINSGGTEFYIALNPQRQLDRNTTVFGKVRMGMEHIQALRRSKGLQGKVDIGESNQIISIKVASDVKKEEQIPLLVMKTDSMSFKELVKVYKHRRGNWFVYSPGYVDLCGFHVPVKLQDVKKK